MLVVLCTHFCHQGVIKMHGHRPNSSLSPFIDPPQWLLVSVFWRIFSSLLIAVLISRFRLFLVLICPNLESIRHRRESFCMSRSKLCTELIFICNLSRLAGQSVQQTTWLDLLHRVHWPDLNTDRLHCVSAVQRQLLTCPIVVPFFCLMCLWCACMNIWTLLYIHVDL